MRLEILQPSILARTFTSRCFHCCSHIQASAPAILKPALFSLAGSGEGWSVCEASTDPSWQPGLSRGDGFPPCLTCKSGVPVRDC
jgi:hypothetical protein